MKVLGRIALATASLLVQAAIPGAQAAPMRYTFYDCGAYADCRTEPPTVLTQFTTRGVIEAPAVPPAGNFTPAEAIEVEDLLAGTFDELGISAFNTNGSIGSLFIFFNLLPENGRAVAPVMTIGAAFQQALRLKWSEGTYTGLALANCYNVSCTVQTPIRGFAKLVAEIDVPPPHTVPEPGALALAALALAVGCTARRVSRSSARR